MPQPPAGEGPPLEWDYGDKRTQKLVFLVVVVLFVLIFTLRDVMRGHGWGVEWMADWVPWVIIGVFSLLFSFLTYGMRVSAGADWLMKNKEFVKTYELTSITLEPSMGDLGSLDIDDRTGNGMSIGLNTLRVNTKLWDLVYNGIKHSVAKGADVNTYALHELHLLEVYEIANANKRAGKPNEPRKGHSIFPNYEADVEPPDELDPFKPAPSRDPWIPRRSSTSGDEVQ